MPPLHPNLRNKLDNTVGSARKVAEEGARLALRALAVGEPQPFEHMTAEQRALRVKLRAKARQLGDEQVGKELPTYSRLEHECAYEHWHQMLFARYLAENSLLIHPEMGVPVTLEECKELAEDAKEKDEWEVAAKFASKMLPQIFRPDDPVLEVSIFPEKKQEMKRLLQELPPEVFTADDSLGWVYQFWQKAKKDEVNRSGEKIDADSLPAVTQLFTEHYMVLFLLHNTIGAWWVGKNLDKEPPLDLEYLRKLDDGTPAAGVFSGWPQTAKELKILDPCCGSGHFLVAAFDMMVRIRMHDEGLSANAACDAVIRDNIHGLEIDPRCTQIAAFALAMAAWKFPGTSGYRVLPEMNIACSGLSVGAKKEEWLKLANGDERLRNGMERLYDLFKQAPLLGSLIDPRAGQGGGLIEAQFNTIRPLFDHVLRKERTMVDATLSQVGIVARGIAEAAFMLSDKFTLVCTNVPYLARGKQVVQLQEHCRRHFPDSCSDLATTFLKRFLTVLGPKGSIAIVCPQNWLFLVAYKKLRSNLLQSTTFDFVAQLGEGGFGSNQAAGAFTALVVITSQEPTSNHMISGLSALEPRDPQGKTLRLKDEELLRKDQAQQLANPDHRIALLQSDSSVILEKYAWSYKGTETGDDSRLARTFWEFGALTEEWRYRQSTVIDTMYYGGCENIVWWSEMKDKTQPGVYIRGRECWGRKGVIVSQMRELPVSLSVGELHDVNAAVLLPYDASHLPALWAYGSSPAYSEAVREIDQTLKVTNATLAKVPFDLDHWTKVAEEKYPNGLPEPYSNDPTQWLFKGEIPESTRPMHVAVARLLGYRWPDQPKDELDGMSDEDGIVCIPPLRQELPGADRLRALLGKAYGDEWSPAKQEELLSAEGYGGKGVEDWLRNGFFEQHCQLFHQRPFIWHIWDGMRDGFSVLVNYHRLDSKNLNNLIYTYLGEWIRIHEGASGKSAAGAEGKVVAARKLKEKLELIAKGESPYDIFVRWKPIEKQPIGWEPDLNDGVRLNIRPFMEAGILRKPPKIKWDKDRGKDPTSAPWYNKYDKKQVPDYKPGDRINNYHLTLEEKKTAREKAGSK